MNSATPAPAPTAPTATPAALKEPDAGHYLGYSRAWLRCRRMNGLGPNYIRVGRSIRYLVRDLDLFLAEHRVTREVR
jgi:hypothetical protein